MGLYNCQTVMSRTHCIGVLKIDDGSLFLTVPDIISNRHVWLHHSLEINLFV